MGKSTACLRIIACGGGSIIAANEAAFVDQTKRPKEKRRWSFKKKSSSSRVVMNPPIAETSSSFEHTDFFLSERDSGPQWHEKSLGVDLHIPDEAIVYEPEKQPTPSAANSYVDDDVSSLQTDKKPATATAKSYVAHEVPSPKTDKHSDAANLCVNDGMSMTVSKTGKYEPTIAVHESDVIVIQDRKELESVIKLQAMIRGHLVRCHAIGALRCLHAIAKMQVLVRARYAHTRKDRVPRKSKPKITYTTMTDLLKNSFARQLLESSPKSKPVKIKCDPLNRDSSWVWLERWMSITSPVEVDDLNARNEMAQEMKITDNECKKKTIAKEQEANITIEDYLLNEENDILLDVKDGSLSLSRESSKLDVTEDTNRDALTLTHSDADSHSASLVESQEVETVEWASDDVSESEPANLSESVLQNARVEKPISVTYSATDYIHESQNEETEMAALAHSSEFDLIGETDASSEDDIVINLEVKRSSIQVGVSNCAVELSELSISSILGSPDISEIELMKVELENSHESKLDTVGDELETELGSVEKQNSESQITPSSQVSVSKKSKIVKKSGSIKKRTILSAAKRSPMNASSEKNISERQSKKRISAKRRTSFGSPKPESSRSSSVPSYMQATKSARAKSNPAGHSSPRSSPDTPDNEVLMKSAKDKQGSPSLSRNGSQTQSGSKSNGTSPLERKWQR